ncbi:MAG: flagellar motor switch protein FliM [Gammaproteobacteria bacterium]|jgi:flagellar motor switch protein FliM|nr:MAG: flagellar motor switch protein FliM [Gammaproteobacteria bacterium]
MASNEILNQEEIDALVSGVESGEIDTNPSYSVNPGEAVPYDLTSQNRIVRGRLPTLELLYERFAKFFQTSMFGMLHRPLEAAVSSIKMLKFSEYVNTLAIPTNLNLMRIAPLKGTGLVILDSRLLFTIVDNFFGGDGRYEPVDQDREFTLTEMRIVHLVLQKVFHDLKSAWHPVSPVQFEYINSEVNPQFANIALPGEVVVVARLRVTLDKSGGELHVVIPYASLEPLRELLSTGMQGDRKEVDAQWCNRFVEELKGAKLGLSCSLAEVELRISDLMKIRPGDVIPIDYEQQVIARVEGQPAFRCSFGIHRGRHALKFIQTI